MQFGSNSIVIYNNNNMLCLVGLLFVLNRVNPRVRHHSYAITLPIFHLIYCDMSLSITYVSFYAQHLVCFLLLGYVDFLLCLQCVLQ